MVEPSEQPTAVTTVSPIAWGCGVVGCGFLVVMFIVAIFVIHAVIRMFLPSHFDPFGPFDPGNHHREETRVDRAMELERRFYADVYRNAAERAERHEEIDRRFFPETLLEAHNKAFQEAGITEELRSKIGDGRDHARKARAYKELAEEMASRRR